MPLMDWDNPYSTARNVMDDLQMSVAMQKATIKSTKTDYKHEKFEFHCGFSFYFSAVSQENDIYLKAKQTISQLKEKIRDYGATIKGTKTSFNEEKFEFHIAINFYFTPDAVDGEEVTNPNQIEIKDVTVRKAG